VGGREGAGTKGTDETKEAAVVVVQKDILCLCCFEQKDRGKNKNTKSSSLEISFYGTWAGTGERRIDDHPIGWRHKHYK
jgi:hypothetical protein